MSKEIAKSNSFFNKAEIDFANKVYEIHLACKDPELIKNPILKGLVQAHAMEAINSLLTPELMKPIEKLFGSGIGIRTDKTYDASTMKRIFIEATLKGWSVVDNHVNVIGGNMYVTKNGYLARLRDLPDFKFNYPFKHDQPLRDEKSGSWSIKSHLQWTINGISYKETIESPIRRQEGMAIDAMWGKADTKCGKFLWLKATGDEVADDSGIFEDANVVSTEINESKTETKLETENQSSTGNNSENQTETVKVVNKVNDELQNKFNTYLNGFKGSTIPELNQRALNLLSSPT